MSTASSTAPARTAWTTTSGARLAFPAVRLSYAEQRILDLIYLDGLTDEQVGFELFRAPGTVSNMLHSIRSKFKAAGRPLPPRSGQKS